MVVDGSEAGRLPRFLRIFFEKCAEEGEAGAYYADVDFHGVDNVDRQEGVSNVHDVDLEAEYAAQKTHHHTSMRQLT